MDEVPSVLADLGVGAAQRHAFLCIGPDCCGAQEGQESWDILKAELKAAGAPILRTKAACLRICEGGPWMVVYPDGIWYGKVDRERCRRIAREHLIGGVPVAEWIVAKAPLDH